MFSHNICHMFVCMSVRLYPINVKTAELIGPKFCVGPHRPQGRIIEAQNCKNVVSKNLDFSKILKIHEKKLLISYNLYRLFYRRENPE